MFREKKEISHDNVLLYLEICKLANYSFVCICDSLLNLYKFITQK